VKKIAAWYRSTSDAFKASLNTAWQAALATFGLSVFGFLHELQEWADSSTDSEFPSVSPLGKSFVSACVGFLAALITYVFRRTVKKPPVYANDGGD